MELIHLSDLHVDKSHSLTVQEGARFRAIVDALVARWPGGMGAPAILITGDLTDDGVEWQWDRIAQELERLVAHGFALRVIPGNHDYGFNGLHATTVHRERFHRRMDALLPPPHAAAEASVAYPRVWEFGEDGTDGAIVCLDSMVAEVYGFARFWAHGRLGEVQRRSLDLCLEELRRCHGEDYPILLALHHHPLPWRWTTRLLQWWDRQGYYLKDWRELASVINGRVSGVLFGHKHIAKVWEAGDEKPSELSRIPLIHGSSASTLKPEEIRLIRWGRGTTPRTELLGLVIED